MDESAFQGITNDRTAQDGCEAGETDRVGHEPGREEQGTGDQQAHALEQAHRRQRARVQVRLDAPQRCKTLRPNEEGPQHRSEHDTENRPAGADEAPDLDQQIDLDQRHHQEHR